MRNKWAPLLQYFIDVEEAYTAAGMGAPDGGTGTHHLYTLKTIQKFNDLTGDNVYGVGFVLNSWLNNGFFKSII